MIGVSQRVGEGGREGGSKGGIEMKPQTARVYICR